MNGFTGNYFVIHTVAGGLWQMHPRPFATHEAAATWATTELSEYRKWKIARLVPTAYRYPVPWNGCPCTVSKPERTGWTIFNACPYHGTDAGVRDAIDG